MLVTKRQLLSFLILVLLIALLCLSTLIQVLFDSDFNVDLDREETSQVWCGDWTEPAGDSTPLVISFHSERGVEMEWSER